ncbi:MAG: tetratricopeptide repeat protein [Saccharofermentanales bacterium]
MKKLTNKVKILKQFLSDRVLMDDSAILPDYYFRDDCLMSPFFLIIQAIKSINCFDLFFAQSILEELELCKIPFLTRKLVAALLCMEKDEMADAGKYLDELETIYDSRPTPYRYYLRAQDMVYHADHQLLIKWYPLARIRFLIYNQYCMNDMKSLKSRYIGLAAAAGIEQAWIDRFELKARMSYYRKNRNLSAQEEEISYLLEEYSEEISQLDIKSAIQKKNVRRQTSFIVQQMFAVIEQYELNMQHKKSLFWCDQILLLQPKSQKSLVTKIEVLKKIKRYQCALGFCNTFIRNDPRDSIGYYLRSNTYFLMNDNNNALQDAQNCYQRSNDKKLGLIARGFSLLNLDEYEKAAGCFEVACSLGIPSYETLRGLGKAYASMNRIIKALECYTQCKHIDPDDPDLLYDIADTQFMGGYFTDAMNNCIACLRLNPDYVGAHVLMGMIALREEKDSLALKYFDQTLVLDPMNPYALNEKGFLCHLSGDDEQAKELIDMALCEYPEYVDALCNKGVICSYAGEYQDAMAFFRQALKILPDHLGSLLGIANLQIQEGDIKEALDGFEAILKIHAANPQALAGRDMLFEIMGISADQDDDEC